MALAQATVAVMGCIALTPAAAHSGVALMPSGEPCDMLADTPAPLSIKHCTQADAGVSADLAPVLPAPVPAGMLVLQVVATTTLLTMLRASAPRNLGPPPILATRRLRI